MRIVENIVRSRIARASHGEPTVEPLRLLKRAGRPELNERYARIRKRLAAEREKSSGAGTSSPPPLWKEEQCVSLRQQCPARCRNPRIF